ncbi:MAG: hemolysin III family protein [Anaerolineae bacterium]|nr:hemolysin III family protein [Anaerolineae bacterium]
MPTKLKKLQERAANNRLYTLGEEIANSITHGIGAGLSVAGLTILVILAVRYGNVRQLVSFSIYGATLIILYLASTLYHSFQRPAVKRVFKIIDHAAIFLLIAGTYTPFLLIGVRGAWGWTLLIIIWGLAILGISFKALFIDRFQKLAVLPYILMGWLSVVMLKKLLVNISLGGLIWLAAGGATYTLGTIFYALKKVPYAHSIWHLFVLGGSTCHFFAVLLYLVPAH